MMNVVKSFGWGNNKPSADSHWNEHIVPQLEWMKGINIGEFLEQYDLPKPIDDNHYEHNITTMPEEKYASYEFLEEETKSLIMELYAEDMELFESTCMTKADPI
jgi:hypothetical protein